MIHRTAIIDPGASLGEGVEVGAYAVVGPKVTLDDGCTVGSHAVIESHARIGKNTRIFPFASVGSKPQDLKFRGEETWVEVGEGCTIREYVTVNRGTVPGGGTTRIGNNVLLMAYCHIAHDCTIGDRVIMANTAALAGHVDIGTGAIIGGLVGIHQFVRVGSYAIVGALSGIGLDIPPYVTAVVARGGKGRGLFGLNLVGLKRNRFPAETIAELKKAYRILFRTELPLREALARAEAETAPIPEVRHLLDFVRSSKRGVQR